MREQREPWFLDRLVSLGWRRERQPVDLVSHDGSRCIEVIAGAQGVRELDAAALRVAGWLMEGASRQGCIVLLGSQLSDERLLKEWETIRRLLRQSVARRIALVVEGFSSAAQPSFPWVKTISGLTRAPQPQPAWPAFRRAAMSPKIFQVLKLIIRHWLLNTGPLSRRRLQAECGATYPTVARALSRLAEFGELERLPDRRFQLRAFPQKTWQEMLSLASSLRRPLSFVDATGREPDPAALLKTLEDMMPQGIAIGGVQAARHWDRSFDLNGLPRLDVVAHAPAGVFDASFVKQLGSTLRVSESPSAEHVLVVHVLPRADALFDQDRSCRLSYADPVETLLDLHELRLTTQADELIAHLSRARRR